MSVRCSEGELVSVSVPVDPRDLEALLDALAHVGFPINPQIYHAPSTVVEFPAYSGGLDEVRQALAASGFQSAAIEVRDALAGLQV